VTTIFSHGTSPRRPSLHARPAIASYRVLTAPHHATRTQNERGRAVDFVPRSLDQLPTPSGNIGRTMYAVSRRMLSRMREKVVGRSTRRNLLERTVLFDYPQRDLGCRWSQQVHLLSPIVEGRARRLLNESHKRKAMYSRWRHDRHRHLRGWLPRPYADSNPPIGLWRTIAS
jgi:hypothetical protein